MLGIPTGPCGAECGDCSSFPVSQALGVDFGGSGGLQSGVEVAYGSPRKEETSVY